MLALRLYNDPREPRSFEGFVVHMHLAWLYLFHAIYIRDGVEIRYRDDSNRIIKVDGEPKCWELSKCIEHRWPSGSPILSNINAFIIIRNKIEHRPQSEITSLRILTAGKSNSHIRNYDSILRQEFGASESLAGLMSIPLFIGAMTPEGSQGLLDLQEKLPNDLKKLISRFELNLSREVLDSVEYELNMKVYLQKANRSPGTLAMQFELWENLTPDEQSAAIQGARDGRTLIQHKHVPVANDQLLKPMEVVSAVSSVIPFKFNGHTHTCCYRKQLVRPAIGSPNPELTLSEFCVYDSAHRDYLYTPAWVARIIKKCASPEGFKSFTGLDPQPKP